MNPFSLPLLISAILGYSSAVFLLLKSKGLKANIIFALVWFSGATWFFGYFLMSLTRSIYFGVVFSKLAYVGVIFIPAFFYHFTTVFLDIKNKQKIVKLVYLQIFIFLLLLLKSDFIVAGVDNYFYGFHTKVGVLHPLFLVIFVALFLSCFIKLYNALKKKKSVSILEYNRIKYMLLAWVIASIGSTDFIADYGVGYYPIGFIFVLGALGIVTYAMLRYRLLDINIVLTRAAIFTFVYILILGLPFGIGSILQGPLSKFTSNWWMIPVFIGLILASAGPFIYMKIQKRVESRLRAEEFKSHEALRRLSHNMLRFTNLEVLLKLVVHYLVKILKLRFAAIYLFDAQIDKYVLRSFWQVEKYVKPPMEFSEDSPLIKDLYLRRFPIVTEELRLFAPRAFSPHIKGLLTTLSKLKANTVIPSFLRKNLLGFLVLSDRRTSLTFTQEDLNLLMVLSNEAALAIENAQFHQKEKSVLAEKSRREALADMAPGASHQFNNRLVAISSSAELLLLKLENIKIDTVKDEDLRGVLKDAKATLEDIDREVYKGKEITSAILKRAKAKVDLQKVSMPNLIENAFRLILISHSKSGLEKFKVPKFKVTLLNEISPMFVSEALLQDCFYNLMDNSFDAIHEKSGLISQGQLELTKDLTFQGEIEVILKQENQTLIIQIKDNGIGLRKEKQRKLFTPYFTTKATSDKGSGLGLYVMRDFIEMHQGTIICDSEYGKGTTFTIKLPIKKTLKNS